MELHDEELRRRQYQVGFSRSAYVSKLSGRDLSRDPRCSGESLAVKEGGVGKSVTWMETVARDIVAPDLEACDEGFAEKLRDLFQWIADGGV